MNVTTLLAALKIELRAQQANTSHTLANGKIDRKACKAALSALINDAFVITDIEYKKVPAAYADVFNLAYEIVAQLETLESIEPQPLVLVETHVDRFSGRIYNVKTPLSGVGYIDIRQVIGGIPTPYQRVSKSDLLFILSSCNFISQEKQLHDQDELQAVVDGMKESVSTGKRTIKYNYPHPLAMLKNDDILAIVLAIEPSYQPDADFKYTEASKRLAVLFERKKVTLKELENVVSGMPIAEVLGSNLQAVIITDLSVELAKLLINKAISEPSIGFVDCWLEQNYPPVFARAKHKDLAIILSSALSINKENAFFDRGAK